ncbi:copper chaperone PCu(A)C [Sphingopyxis chilensis]|uniref:copper chaperone PCu(A)C n=1 Tax=Sphingopyxis chilensis TaxID=180400 RepID=UPI002DDC9584|nr:copper chaperone PCu(A)C [Sphingopyxis chilensis]
MNLARCAAAAALLAAAATPLFARSPHAGSLSIERGWSRQTAPGQTVGGGFVTITNRGGAGDRLVAANSPISREVQLHTMSVDEGVMRMRPVGRGIAIPVGKTVELKPGGLHIMFVGLKRPLTPGQSFPVTLRFQLQGAVEVDFRVVPVGSAGPGEARHDRH